MSLGGIRRRFNMMGDPSSSPYCFLTNLLVRPYAMPDEMKLEFSAEAGSQGVADDRPGDLYRSSNGRLRVPDLLHVRLVARFAQFTPRATSGDQETAEPEKRKGPVASCVHRRRLSCAREEAALSSHETFTCVK